MSTNLARTSDSKKGFLAIPFNMSEEDVIKKVFLNETVDGEFTTTADIANTVAFLAGFETNALTGQSIVVSHGWSMI